MDLKSYFVPQKMMRNVLLSLLPIILFAIYSHGWRLIVLLASVLIAAIAAEYLVMRSIQKEKTKVSEAVIVSAFLFTLSLPPATPIWIAIVGILVGVVFGKCAFGGFGRNIFNPALVGRCFIYISFPYYLTMNWSEPFKGLPGGFAAYQAGADAITSTTPMINIKAGGEAPGLGTLILGTHASSLGEGPILLIILAAIYLIYTKTASWKIMVSTIGGAAVSTLIFTIFGANTAPFHTVFLTGGLLFAAVFMATDPVSAPRDETAKIIVGALIGCFAMIIRTFALFTEGVMFAILIANALTPLIERSLKEARENKNEKELAKS